MLNRDGFGGGGGFWGRIKRHQQNSRERIRRAAIGVQMLPLEARVLFCGLVADESVPHLNRFGFDESSLTLTTNSQPTISLASEPSISAPPGAPGPDTFSPTINLGNYTYAANGLPQLDSNENAFANLFLDFDGGLWQDTWYRPYAKDGDDTTFNTAEQSAIVEMWLRVSEAFSPFNLNVTTVDPGNLNERETGTIVMAGNAGGGGFGYVGGFYNGSDNKGIAMTSPSTSAKTIAYVAIHEAGHVMDLWHQSLYDANGVKLQEYYSGNSIIAPIMGSAYHPQRAIWWNGTSSLGSTIPQDDLAIISGTNNAYGYRPDDVGSNWMLATPLSSGAVSTTGIIERMSDEDFFSFESGVGTISLTGAVTTWSPTLDMKLELYEWDGLGYVSVASASTASIGESLSFATDGGTFALAVRSQGAYGDIGQYRISGTVPSVTPALATPSDVKAVASATNVHVTWGDESSNEDDFRILRSDDNGQSWVDLGTVAADTESFDDTTAATDETYYYTVTAENSGGNSPASAPARAVTFSGPSNLTVTNNTATRVTLAWSDSVASDRGVLIEKSTDGGVTWTGAAAASPTMTSLEIRSLTMLTNYQFRIRSHFDGIGYGLPSNVVSLTTPEGFVPAAPSSITLTPQGPYVFIANWTNVSDETGYVLQRSTDGVNFTHLRTTGANGTSHWDQHNSPETTFYYRVKAFNDIGDSGWSPVVSATSEEVNIPGAPTGLHTISFEGDSGYLTWTDNADDEDSFIIEIGMYNPEYDEYEWEFWDATGTNNNWYHFQLDFNWTYQFRVAAQNISGMSDWSNTITIFTGPETPTSMAATRTGASAIHLTWNDATGAENYVIERSVGNPWQFQPLATISADSNDYTDNTASEFESYTYRVRAYNNSTTPSVPSNSATVNTTYLPQAPTNASAGPSLRATAVRITWTDGIGESSYRVERSADGVDDWEYVTENSGNYTKADDYNVSLGETWYYRVIAVNPVGESAPSNIASGSPGVVQLPPAPANLRLMSATTSELTLTWDSNPDYYWNFFLERYDTNSSQWQEITDWDDPENPRIVDNSGLSAGTLYTYRIRGYNQAGYSDYSNELTTSTITTAPTNFVITSVTWNAVNMSWTDVTGEETYTIQRSLNASTWTNVGSTGPNVTTFTDTTATVNTGWYYRVVANNLGGSSAPSGSYWTFVPLPPPTTPTGLAVTNVTATRVDLSWNDVQYENQYKIQRSTDGVNFFQIGTTPNGDITTYTDFTVATGTTYYYRVVASNFSGNSAPSSAVSATTLMGAPTNVTATAVSSSQINVSWSDIIGETFYTIERSNDGTSGWSQVGSTGANVTTFQNTGLLFSATYFYRVRASNGAVSSPYSSVVNATTQAAIPSAPSGLSATAVSTTQVNLSWSDVYGETQYRVERATDSVNFTQIGTTGANVLAYSDTTALAGTSYQYRVRAANGAGASGPSNVSSVTTPLAAPASLGATAVSSSQINLSWGNVAGESGYAVERSADGVSGWTQIGTTGVDVTTFQNTGLLFSATYFYRVKANAGASSSAYSNVASATTPAAIPSAPSGLAATAVSTTQVDLAWSDVYGETQYRVERSTDSVNYTQIGTTGAGVLAYSDTTATAGTAYQYRVRAANSAGASTPSNVATATTIPAAPASLTATAASPSQINLSWGNVSGETGFVIQRSPDGSTGWTQVGTTAVNVTTFQNTGLTASTTYFYRVYANNAAGSSAFSNTSSATTMVAIPAAPTNLAATALSTTVIRLTWSDVVGETSYQIERSNNGTSGWQQIGTTGANVVTFDNTGLKKNTRYYYRVRAANSAGNSPYSNVANAQTPASGAALASSRSTSAATSSSAFSTTSIVDPSTTEEDEPLIARLV